MATLIEKLLSYLGIYNLEPSDYYDNLGARNKKAQALIHGQFKETLFEAIDLGY